MKRQPRGIPVGGQFAESARGEADVAVANTAATLPPLAADHRIRRDDALRRLGLDVSDVPGLAEAWDEHYADLDRPFAETPNALARTIVDDEIAEIPFEDGYPRLVRYSEVAPSDVQGDPVADSDLVIEIKGAVSEKGYHEHYDGDDWDASCSLCGVGDLEEHPDLIAFDKTSGEALLRVPASYAARAEHAMVNPDAEDLRASQNVLMQDLRDVQSGRAAPWTVLADPDEYRRVQNDLSEARSSARAYSEDADRENRTLSRLIEDVDAGGEIRPFEGRIRIAQKPWRGRSDEVQVASVTYDRIAPELRGLVASKGRRERLEKVWKAAQKVEDPALREWLISQGDAAPTTLDRELRSAQQALDSASQTASMIELSREMRDRTRKELDDALTAQEDVKDISWELWSLGWTGKGPVPRQHGI